MYRLRDLQYNVVRKPFWNMEVEDETEKRISVTIDEDGRICVTYVGFDVDNGLSQKFCFVGPNEIPNKFHEIPKSQYS